MSKKRLLKIIIMGGVILFVGSAFISGAYNALTRTSMESRALESDKPVEKALPEDKVYSDLEDLFKSEDNPYNWENDKITQVYGSDIEAWNKAVVDYENESIKQVADKYRANMEQITNIYYKYQTK